MFLFTYQDKQFFLFLQRHYKATYISTPKTEILPKFNTLTSLRFATLIFHTSIFATAFNTYTHNIFHIIHSNTLYCVPPTYVDFSLPTKIGYKQFQD